MYTSYLSKTTIEPTFPMPDMNSLLVPLATAEESGYRHLASFMSWEPSCAIFPRFRSSNILCLMQMQSEITALEEKLQDLAFSIGISGDEERKKVLSDWSHLESLGKDSVERKLHAELRRLLGEYNAALAHNLTLQSQPGPEADDFAYLQYWLQHPKGGASSLRGPGALTWNPLDEGGRGAGDMISLEPSAWRERTLTRWLSDLLWRFLRQLPGPLKMVRISRFDPSLPDFTTVGSSKSWAGIGDQISSLIATVLMLIPVITLHFVESANSRLIVIVVFTVAFQGMVVLMTQASRSEVFAATAAFLAIQVIYVGSALGPASG